MGLRDDQWFRWRFQSRLGKYSGYEPNTEARIDELAAQGVKRLLCMCPALRCRLHRNPGGNRVTRAPGAVLSRLAGELVLGALPE